MGAPVSLPPVGGTVAAFACNDLDDGERLPSGAGRLAPYRGDLYTYSTVMVIGLDMIGGSCGTWR